MDTELAGIDSILYLMVEAEENHVIHKGQSRNELSEALYFDLTTRFALHKVLVYFYHRIIDS